MTGVCARASADELVHDPERVHGDVEEERALEVHDRDRRPVLRGGRTASRAPRARPAADVRGAHDPVARVEERDEVALAPDVVAGRDRVGAGGEELLRRAS